MGESHGVSKKKMTEEVLSPVLTYISIIVGFSSGSGANCLPGWMGLFSIVVPFLLSASF